MTGSKPIGGQFYTGKSPAMEIATWDGVVWVRSIGRPKSCR